MFLTGLRSTTQPGMFGGKKTIKGRKTDKVVKGEDQDRVKQKESEKGDDRMVIQRVKNDDRVRLKVSSISGLYRLEG